MKPMPIQGTSVIMVVYCCPDVSGNMRRQNSGGWGKCVSPNIGAALENFEINKFHQNTLLVS
jgi:hypothetical protein